MRMRIKNGRVIDPGNFDGVADILIAEGRIAALIRETSSKTSSAKGNEDSAETGSEAAVDQIVDAAGCIVVPGLIDMHVHLREPGQEYKETIETGIAAAAAGGFTAICCMPNTCPVNDNAQITKYIIDAAKRCESVNVYPVGAISRALEGTRLAEYGDLKSAGAVAITDDGKPVTNAQLMRRALEYAKGVGLPVISHCEDMCLSCGVMNEGPVATRLGLSGIPNAAESVMVMRDIALCALTGSPLHIAHVSTRESVAAIRAAKKQGVPITAETAPHYFTLTDTAVEDYNTHAKMNPPLRSDLDRQAVREGLADGTIDVIATDHAPHSIIEKAVEFDAAANGIIGLETALSLGLSLVDAGVLRIDTLIEKMAINPGRVIGVKRRLVKGAPADITIIDTNRKFTYLAAQGRSRSINSPFDGWEFKGKAKYTLVGGRVVFTDV